MDSQRRGKVFGIVLIVELSKSASLTRTIKVCSSDRRELEDWAREHMDK